MAAWTTYDTVGKKEDISDVISNISPTETPFSSAIGSESIHNTLVGWQEDALAAVNLNNKNVQGADATETAPSATVMRQNYTQILEKTLKVADTVDAVAHYGRAKEMAYQVAKYSKEVKRDFEAIALSTQTAVAGSNAVAGQFDAFSAQVDPALLLKTGAGVTLGSATTGVAMSETNLNDQLQALYTNGASPKVLSLPPGESKVVAAFASAAGRYRTLETSDPTASKKIVNAVNLYVSPFGEVKVILNRFQPATDYLIYDPDMWKKLTLRPWTRETLAKTGDSTKMQIKGEFSLKHKNRKAAAIVRKYLP